MKRGRHLWVKKFHLAHSDYESLVAPEEVHPAELRDEMLIEILQINVSVLQRSTIEKGVIPCPMMKGNLFSNL